MKDLKGKLGGPTPSSADEAGAGSHAAKPSPRALAGGEADAGSTVLARYALAFIDGKEIAVIAWLQELGCTVILVDEQNGVWHLDGPLGVRVGLSRGLDPVSTTAQIGFLLGGINWTQTYPRALKIGVTTWEAKTRKARRGARTSPPQSSAVGDGLDAASTPGAGPGNRRDPSQFSGGIK